ncbi:MAG TPA: hypothetical protein VGD05_00705, partial [Pyrinomonadaceae bacterium]
LSIYISISTDFTGYQEKLPIVVKFQKNLRFRFFPREFRAITLSVLHAIGEVCEFVNKPDSSTS